MPGTAGPRLGLVWGYVPGETGWGVSGFNPNFLRLETLVHLTVTSITATPPGSPANGDCYIVGVGATGVWAGQDERVAVWYAGWTFIVPAVGVRAWNVATGTYWRYGGDWVEEAAADLSGPGSSVDGGVAVWDGTTGTVLKDSTQTLPTGFIVGHNDPMELTNKVINGLNNTLVVRLHLDVVGNLPVENLNAGIGASGTTVWYGDGTWKPVAGAGVAVVDDAPPTGVTEGQLWFNSASGRLMIFYDAVWVEV